MSSFAPRAAFTPHHFEIAENGRGYWVAQDQEGLVGGVFRTQKDALRFALFEAAGDSACVRVLPVGSALVVPITSKNAQASDNVRPFKNLP